MADDLTDLLGEVGLADIHETLFVGVAVDDDADVVADTDDADNDDLAMTMMTMVAGKPTVNERIPLNTNCGYRNWT